MIKRLELIKRHVDLSHIQSVGEAYFNDLMGSGGWFVGFTIDFILRDTPSRYEWPADQFGDSVRFTASVGHMVQYEDGVWSNNVSLKDHGQLLCLKILNERIEQDIIAPWRAWKETS